MSTGEQPLRIIGNESNQVYEIEPGSNTQKTTSTSTEEGKSKEQPVADNSNAATQTANNDLATNDGAVIETLDTAFHNKPGIVEGINLSGSNRADYYEGQSYGQSDAAEEINPSPTK